MAEDSGKFSSIPQDQVPEEAKESFNSMSQKSESLKSTRDELAGVENKDDLKSKLPKAIVLKKNLKKDVDQMYSRYKELKANSSDPDELSRFKEACNDVIRNAQQAHQEIKDKVYSIYDKKSS
jgi:hypothetical protein